MRISLQVAQELISAAQVAIDNQRIDFRLGKLGLRPFRVRLDIARDLKSTEDTFQNADLLKVPRNHHR